MLDARLARGLEGLQVLDLFAGSGALALEALSRGAAAAVAVDTSSAAQRAIRDNAARLGFAATCTVLRMPVLTALDRLGQEGRRFDLVLADPPYAHSGDELLQAIAQSGLLERGAFVMLEHSRRQAPGETVGGLQLEARRRHGDTELSLYAVF